MKKLAALVLVLVLMLGTLSGCSKIVEKLPEGVQNTIGSIKDKFNDIIGRGDDDNGEENLALAGDFLVDLYKDKNVLTPSNFDLVKQIKIGDADFTIEWSVDNEAIVLTDKDGDIPMKTVVVPVEPMENVNYTLTATIKDADGNTITKTFSFTVPKFEYLTHAEYMEAEEDAAVVVKGIVTVIMNNTKEKIYEMHLQDETGAGGYHVFGLEANPAEAGVKVGMTVQVVGTKGDYYGAAQIINATVTIKDETVKTVAPIDLTAAYVAAADLTADELAKYLGALVTVKGVEITDQPGNGYHNFKLAGKESYLRLSSSQNPIDLTTAIKDKISADHAAKKGWTADVVGIATTYNGAFYIRPIDGNCFTYISEIQRSDKEKAEVEAGALELGSTVFKVDSTVTLPTASTYADEVTIAWKSDNTCVVVSPDGKSITVTLQETEQTVKLTATVTCGTETATKEFTLTVAKTSGVTPEVAEELDTAKVYKLYLFQKTNKTPLYLCGGVGSKDYYLKTSESHEEAKDIYVEAVTGGYRIYYKEGEVKTYIDIYLTDTGYVNARFTSEPTAVFTFDAERKLLVTTIGDKGTYYLGTYGTHDTISACQIAKIDNTDSCAAQLVTLVDVNNVTSEEKVNTELENLTFGQTEFTQNESTVTLPVATTFKDVVITWSVVGENVTGVTIKDGVLSVSLEREAKDVVIKATITHGTATKEATFTLELAARSYMNIDTVEQAPAIKDDNDEPIAYKLYLVQAQKGQTLYFNGSTTDKSWYLATTTAAGLAIDVYLEEVLDTDNNVVAGSYRIYFIDANDVKTYIRFYERTDGEPGEGSGSLELVPVDDDFVLPTETYTWDETLKTLVYTPDADNKYYMGAYGSNTYVQGSNTSYVTAENLEKSQYPLHLAIMTCEHYYAQPCSEVCEDCGAPNANKAEHPELPKCAEVCVCGKPLEHEDHKISADGSECEYCHATGAEISAIKVAAEKAALKNISLNYTTSAQFIIALKGVKYEDVTITWTSSNTDFVTIAGNVVTVKLGAQAPAEKIKLTATLTCGEGDTAATDKVEYELTLAAAPTLDKMTVAAPEVGVEYDFYIGKADADIFFIGKTTDVDFRFASTTTAALSVKVKLEAVEGKSGEYRLYFDNAGVKTYIVLYEYNTTKHTGSCKFVPVTGDDFVAPTETYVWNSTYNTLVHVAASGHSYYIGTEARYSTFSGYNLNLLTEESVDNTHFPARLMITDCKHAYDGACDDACNACGLVRTGIPAHAYTLDCEKCDTCGKASGTAHVIVDCTGATTDGVVKCQNCAKTGFTASEAHTTTSCTDIACQKCATTLAAKEHTRELCEDTVCSTCHNTIPAEAHNYVDGVCAKCEKSLKEVAKVMLDAEIAALTKVPTYFANSMDFVVQSAPKAYNGVTFTWTLSDNAGTYVTKNGNVISVRLGATAPAATITLTLTLEVTVEGQTFSTATFKNENNENVYDLTWDLTLKAQATYDVLNVINPQVDTPYYLYIHQNIYKDGASNFYAKNGISKGKIQTVAMGDSALIMLYLEAVLGADDQPIADTYKLYFKNGDTKTYFYVTDEVELAKGTSNVGTFKFNRDYGVLTAEVDGTEYFIGVKAQGETTTKNIQVLPLFLLEEYDVGVEVTYEGKATYLLPAYLATLNRCGEHKYANDCDANCDICGATRTAPHTFAADCAAKCSDCDYTREAAEKHEYESLTCSEECKNCGEERTAPHSFKCDSTVCATTGCGATRAEAAGTCTDGDADEHCDECGFEVNGIDTPVVPYPA